MPSKQTAANYLKRFTLPCGRTLYEEAKHRGLDIVSVYLNLKHNKRVDFELCKRPH